MPRLAGSCMREINSLHPDFCRGSKNYEGALDACMNDQPYKVDNSPEASGNCTGGRRRRKSNARKSRKSRSSKRSRKHRR